MTGPAGNRTMGIRRKACCALPMRITAISQRSGDPYGSASLEPQTGEWPCPITGLSL